MRETRQSGSEGGEGSLPDPYHVITCRPRDVDGRHKAAHDDEMVKRHRRSPTSIRRPRVRRLFAPLLPHA
jgi:hypothetical protein